MGQGHLSYKKSEVAQAVWPSQCDTFKPGLSVQVSGTYLLWVTCPITPLKSPSPGDANGPSGFVS